MDFSLSSTMKLELKAGETADPSKNMVFRSIGGSTFTTHDAQTGTLLLELIATGEKPIAAQDLVWNVQRRLGLESAKPIRKLLIEHGIALMLRGYIKLHGICPHYMTTISDKPVVHPLARLQAGIRGCDAVSNALCAPVKTNAMWNIVLQNLDGQNTVADVVDTLVRLIESGKLTISLGTEAIKDSAGIRNAARISVDEILAVAAKNALLVA